MHGNSYIYKRYIVILLLVFFTLSSFFSCEAKENERKKNNYPTYFIKNWENYLESVRNGVGINRKIKPLYSHYQLDLLNEYLAENNKEIYKGDSLQWLFDRAMIALMKMDVIESFNLFKEYMDKSRDYIKPLIHVGAGIGLNNSNLKVTFLDNAMLLISKDKSYRLPFDEALYFVRWHPSAFFALIKEDRFPTDLKKNETYKELVKNDRRFEEDLKQNKEELFNEFYILEFPESFINEIKNDNPTDMEKVNIYNYYYTKKEFLKAYEVAKSCDYGEDFNISEYFYDKYIFQSILEVLYRLDKYDELLDVYERFKDEKYLIYNEATYSSGYFWVASAYAKQAQFDKTLEFLQKAFEVTTLRNIQDRDGLSEMNTFALIWNISISDAFESFKKAGRYDEIEEMMRAKLDKYKNLDWFRH